MNSFWNFRSPSWTSKLQFIWGFLRIWSCCSRTSKLTSGYCLMNLSKRLPHGKTYSRMYRIGLLIFIVFLLYGWKWICSCWAYYSGHRELGRNIWGYSTQIPQPARTLSPPCRGPPPGHFSLIPLKTATTRSYIDYHYVFKLRRRG